LRDLINPLTIWRFTDGRAGHDSQSLGLSSALSALTACKITHIPVPHWSQLVRGLINQKFIPELSPPDPHLLIGAGHKTHLALLCARTARGGKAVVLMKPSLPVSWFDLCLIPEHDKLSVRKNVIRTRGPLNQIRARQHRTSGRGMILVGGPSTHYSWDPKLLEDQLRQIISSDPDCQWVLTDSPRTPDICKSMFSQLAADNMIYKPFSAVSRNWLADELPAATVVWVTEDSVSMIYEALTAGAKVGLLEVPVKRRGRLTNAINQLILDGTVISYKGWQTGQMMLTEKVQLDESARCAQLLLERFFPTSSINGQQ